MAAFTRITICQGGLAPSPKSDDALMARRDGGSLSQLVRTRPQIGEHHSVRVAASSVAIRSQGLEMSAGAVVRFRARDVIHSGSPYLAHLSRPRLSVVPVKLLANLAIALLLASTTLIAHAADTSGAGRYSDVAMFARLHSLPPVLQKAMVAIVWTDVNKNDDDVETETPDKLLDALKIRAIEADRMKRVADAAGWPEAGHLLAQLSDAIVHVIRRDVSSADSRSAVLAVNTKYRSMIETFKRENETALNDDPGEGFASLRKDFVTFIAAPARIYVWGGKSKVGAHASDE